MRLGVIADIHGNLLALEAVLAKLDDLGVDRIVNLGDCASGPLWPAETAALLRSRGSRAAPAPCQGQGHRDVL